MDHGLTPRSRPARRAVAIAIGAALLFGAVLAAALNRVPASVRAADTASAEAVPAPSVQARSGMLIDRRSGRVLWSKSPDLQLGPASCTKIMTALLALEHYGNLARYVRAPASAATQSGIGLRGGDRITVRQALYALMVRSANDACLTLACAVSGSESRFVTKMNRRAASLGLTHTHFVNSRGRPAPRHRASARDLARLGRYAMRDARFRAIVATQTTVIRWPPSHAVSVASHNRLLNYSWGDGIKTGATRETGMILVGSGKPELVPLIVVTMREPSRNREEVDAVAMLGWGSALYERRELVAAGDVVAELAVDGGSAVAAVAASSRTAVVRKAATVRAALELPAQLPTRPADGTLLGRVTYWSDRIVLGRVDLLAGTMPVASPGP